MSAVLLVSFSDIILFAISGEQTIGGGGAGEGEGMGGWGVGGGARGRTLNDTTHISKKHQKACGHERSPPRVRST